MKVSGSQEQEALNLVQQLVPALLGGTDPRLGILRAQWNSATVNISSFSTVGFYADFLVPEEAERVPNLNVCGGDAEIYYAGGIAPATCVLYVQNGTLSFLEVANSDGWDEAPKFGPITGVSPIDLGQ